MKTVTVRIPDGRYSLWAVAVYAGTDINVTICGGDQDHIGAVATGIVRSSLADPEKHSASTSVLCISGHKEDELAKMAAHHLATVCGGVASVSAGIHIDNAEPTEINRLLANVDGLLDMLIEALGLSQTSAPAMNLL